MLLDGDLKSLISRLVSGGMLFYGRKREAKVLGVIESTVGMYGDLQGIAGKALQGIDGLDLPLIEGVSACKSPKGPEHSLIVQPIDSTNG